MHKVFVSYVFEDHAYRDQVRDWGKKGLLGGAEVVFEQDDVRQGGDKAIRDQLRPIIRDAAAILVLVGSDTHNRRWVDEEIQYALSNAKPILWTQLPSTRGAPPPALRTKPQVPFSPDSLRAALVTALSNTSR